MKPQMDADTRRSYQRSPALIGGCVSQPQHLFYRERRGTTGNGLPCGSGVCMVSLARRMP